jgi:hypothetical protein
MSDDFLEDEFDAGYKPPGYSEDETMDSLLDTESDMLLPTSTSNAGWDEDAEGWTPQRAKVVWAVAGYALCSARAAVPPSTRIPALARPSAGRFARLGILCF